jgi:antitoxin (DNA-binding transcriptional repressor) of toxin-antitoxin stability system
MARLPGFTLIFAPEVIDPMDAIDLTMKRVPVADVEGQLATYLEECQRERPIVLTENGRAIAVLLAPRNEEDLERLILSHSPRFQAVLARSRQSIEAGKGLSRDEFWQAVEQRDGDNERPSKG